MADILAHLRLVCDSAPETPEHDLECALKLDPSVHPTIHRDTLIAAATQLAILRRAVNGYQIGMATGLVAITEEEYAEIPEVREEAALLRRQMDAKIVDFLNEKMCCNGQECGCMGVTRLQQYVQEEAGSQLSSLSARLELAEKQLDWLDRHTCFVADSEFKIGPYKVGQLRQMANDGIAQSKALHG